MRVTLNRFLRATLCGVLLTAAGLSAGEEENYRIVDGVAIYLGIVPAEVLLGHPPQHPEREMHEGVPRARMHLVVALFDNETGERIRDAQVTATVTEVGLAGQTKSLEPMEMADVLTFGNYFTMRGHEPYRIVVQIRRPHVASEIEAQFAYRHYRE